MKPHSLKSALGVFGLTAAVLTALTVTAGVANAGALTIVGGTAGTIPQTATDQVLPIFGIPTTGPAYGYFGSNIQGPAGKYRVDVYGAEAGFRNNFEAPTGSTIYTHPGGTVIGDPLLSVIVNMSTNTGGWLDFAFSVNGAESALPNGSNPDETGPVQGVPTFFASCDLNMNNGPRTCRTITLHLDDAGGGDDDHDDLVVGLTHIAVPEPMSLALFGLGLAGLGVARRRAKRA